MYISAGKIFLSECLRRQVWVKFALHVIQEYVFTRFQLYVLQPCFVNLNAFNKNVNSEINFFCFEQKFEAVSVSILNW